VEESRLAQDRQPEEPEEPEEEEEDRQFNTIDDIKRVLGEGRVTWSIVNKQGDTVQAGLGVEPAREIGGESP
jgi:hypothetical protein